MDFEVVIVGSDINAYYMARCCHEAYNKKAYLIAKEPMNFTRLSSILNIEYHDNLWDTDVFNKTLEEFGKKHNDKKLLLIGSNDFYVRLMIENEKMLKKYYIFPTISVDLLNDLLIKDKFYKRFKKYDIDLPDTYIYNPSKDKRIDMEKINNFGYPLILKAGDGVNYYKHHFNSQAKVYKIKDFKELCSVLSDIKESGYTDNLVIQKFIPGGDDKLFDSMFYCDKSGKVKLVSFAQIGLQERNSTGVGNCTALVNGYSEFGDYSKQVERLKKVFEEINYHGFAEVDMKYDITDNKYKVLEINPRQARSSYYLCACGFNLVKYLVDDLIFDKKLDYKLIKKKMVLTFVPKYVIKKYVISESLRKEMLDTIKEGLICDPLDYKEEKLLKRKIWLIIRKFNYIRKYKKYHW